MGGALDQLPVLIIDCQTTGPTPDNGHLLEVAWCRSMDDEVTSHLVRLPNGAKIPRPIARMTGIGDDDLTGAIDHPELWRHLAPAEGFAVAHFARFEERFLRHLHAECAPDRPFPFRFLCTHQIARRLFPDLPRRGLRALSGFFGFSLPELKRAGPHAEATRVVWAHLVDLLRCRRGVETLDELLPYLASPPPSRGRRFRVPLEREKRLALADRPGVYRFLGRDGCVLYVGKASSLHKRVNSYYRKRRAEDKVLELISQARDIAVTETGTALEAALLEVEEIKRCAPPYNRALRERDTNVWFFSLDLHHARPAPDARHPIGPVPHREGLETIHLLARLITGRQGVEDETAMLHRLGFGPREIAAGALREGLAQFAASVEGAEPIALLRQGSIWRREREDEAPEEEPAEEEDRPLDAADVARFLEGLVIHASRLRGRARWLVQLTDAVLCWIPTQEPPDRRKVLITEKGRVGRVGFLEAGDIAPVPPGHTRARPERQRLFDRAAYDRLRILSTELRRLVIADRAVEVVFSPTRRLDAGRLKRLVEWV